MLVPRTICAAALSVVFGVGVYAAADSLRSELTLPGVQSLFPGDAGYANASRAFNLRFTLEPVAVVFPSTPQELSEIVQIGHKNRLRVAARSGGHSYIANGLGGENGTLVVDMARFTNITVNPEARTAIVGSGNRLGDIALALNDYGLGTAHGTCPYVGIGGHSSYGGFGFTSRMWGLTLDNVLSLELVLANGTITKASKDINPDLFWAMRGAGPSFAITTAIELAAYPAPASVLIFQYNWQLNVDQAADALSTFETFSNKPDLSPEFGAEIVLTRGAIAGNVSWGLTGAWHGDPNLLNDTVAPFLNAMPPLHGVTFTPGNWIESVTVLAGSTLNTSSAPDYTDTCDSFHFLFYATSECASRFYAKSLVTPAASPMNDAARKAFMSHVAFQGFTTNTSWFFQIELYGGANSKINAVPTDATAFVHRSSTFTIQFYASSFNNAPPYPDSGFTFLDDLVDGITSNSPKDWDYGAYTNYMEDKLVDFKQRYYGSHYPRLLALKKSLDPTGVFDFPVGIDD
ncbi:glucooligosaccharide oxidase [Roridomyces roridus]|uniref:Glucooligosaccharide oxidase n=1 Tax=Roridomyces roridus TaxID=1738132 RepID=A0AAD7BF33_9AGAR|nr:glucooligosaccharide oxidase [Roridomyces roridus]